MKVKHAVLLTVGVLASAQHEITSARMTDATRNDVAVGFHRSCVASSSKEGGQEESRLAKIRKACTCLAEEISKSLDDEKFQRLAEADAQAVRELTAAHLDHCKTNFASYPEEPRINASLLNDRTNESFIFSGRQHRFTAFKEDRLSGDGTLEATTEFRNGKHLYDIEIDLQRATNYLYENDTRTRYELSQMSETNDWMKRQGYDFAFSIHEPSHQRWIGTLLINSRRNTLATLVTDPKLSSAQLRHYVRSQALICTALSEMRSRIQREAAVSIFREVLLVAIKSYAGASYSGGNFTAYTTSGRTITGTYTKYDNSWLGEHYSRGLDAIFNGAGSLSTVNAEIDRLDCGSFQ